MNWLDFSYAKQVGELGDLSGYDYVNKLSAVGLSAIKGKTSGQHLVSEASAVRVPVSNRYRVRAHELIVGQVLVAQSKDNFKIYRNFALQPTTIRVDREAKRQILDFQITTKRDSNGSVA
ncbi:MAG TPA: hypothetical protein VLV31_09485 [Candidatus Acidoferrales bacterium]|nr:hypothetical protein [Candidatus Acidoferrales bacterium]